MVPGFKTTEIKPAKTVGQRLKTARLKRKLTLTQAEELTKVKLKYLKALENDRHDQLPTEVYSLGFLRCYGEALELNTKKLLEQYQAERKSFKSAKGQSQQVLAPTKRLQQPSVLVTPKTVFTLASIAVVVGLVLYIALGVRGFLAPPELTINEPKVDALVDGSKVTVAGLTDPTASLTINGELVTLSVDGQFKQDIAIIPGLNTLEFVSINRVGKMTKEVRKVLADYQPSPSPSPLDSPAPEVSPTPSPSPTMTAAPRTSASPSSSVSPTTKKTP